MAYKVSDVCGECFQFGWVEIDKKNKKVKWTLTQDNWIIRELKDYDWAQPLFEKKLIPRFRQISEVETAIVPKQDLKHENRGKSIDVIWIDIDYIEHMTFHLEFTANQMILALRAIFELQLVLEKNGWYIRFPHLGNVTFTPEPMMFDLGDIRKNDLIKETANNYTSIFTTLPQNSIDKIVGFEKLIKHLTTFEPGSPSENVKFVQEALNIIDTFKTKESENYWDNYNSGGDVPVKGDLEAFKKLQPPKSESIASVLLELNPKTVVDVGCSEGYYSFMAESYGAESVLGIDYSEKVINIASQVSIARKSNCKFAYYDLTKITSEFANRVRSDFAIGAAIMHHLFKAGMSFEKMADLFASLGENCMIEYIAPFDMHKLNNDKYGHTLNNFRNAFSRYWDTIELLPTIPMGSKPYEEWFNGWLKENPDATLADMPRLWLKCSNRKPIHKPLVSIGLAVYNEERHIRMTIESLLKQDFVDFELIIVDNASTDKTFEICSEYAKEESRIRLHRNEKNIGSATIKKVLKMTNGKYFMLAGGHDLWEPTFISKCVNVLSSEENVVLCHAKCGEIDNSGKLIRIMPDNLETRNLSLEETLPQVWSLKTGVPIYGVMLLEAFTSINLDQVILGSDIILLSKLSTFGSIAYIDELLIYQRTHRAPESSEQSVRRTLVTMSPNNVEKRYKTAWLDLLRGHLSVLSNLDISSESENYLLHKLMESFKLNYGQLPENEVKALADSYIAYFSANSTNQNNISIFRKAQVALDYVNSALLLYPEMSILHKAYMECSKVINSGFSRLSESLSIKIAGQDSNEKDLTQIDSVSEFAIQLSNVIKEFKPKKLIETGTYLGMGTTTVVTTALKENGLDDSQFFSIEVKPENHLVARKNLTESGLIPYVTLLNGLSMPRKQLPTIEEIERTTVKDLEFEGIYVDHQESERAKLYYNETNYDNVEEDLIGKCLITFENKPDFVLLDSGGHMGNLEFNYLIERLEKECIVALDDVNHIKHRKSYMQIQNDSRFELITSSDEKFGFCIAKFTPQKDRIVPVQSPIKIHPKKILFIRTDAVGDNILASVVLKGIKEKYPKADITIICNEFISELYEYSPYVKNVIGINRTKFEEDDEYKGRFLTNIKSQKYDLAVNPIYSSDSIVDILLFTAGAKQTIRIDGNSENFAQGWQWVKSANEKATHVIRTGAGWRSEFDRHKDFLNGFGVNTADIEPEMWLSKEDEEFADKVFSDNNLDPDKTIVLFAGAKYDLRVFKNYGKALSGICEKNNFAVIAVGSRSDEKINQENLNDINAFTLNLSGNTTLRQTAAIIKKSRLAIGAETGNAHIACAVGTPNVILIGGGHFGRFMPYSKLTSLVTLPLDCFGCNWICQYNRTHCVKDVNPELLSKAIEDILLDDSQKPRIYFNELPDGEGRSRLRKMLSQYVNIEDVKLVEVKSNEDSTYCKNILYLAEELIQSNEIENAKKLLSNILLLELLNVDALNNLAVIEILSENWTNALDILVKTLEIDPDNDVALGNLQFINEKLNPTITSSDDESGEVENKKSDQVISKSGEIKLSAIVSVYNAERFIRGCMEDLISQTIYQHGEMEIVIVETGSQQNEKEIIDEYVNKYPNINYIRIPERETVYQAWNRGVRAAKGKYLTNANADDRHRVNGLERLVELLEKNSDKVLAYGDSVVSEVENDSFENCTVLDYLLWPDFDKMEMLDKCYIGPHPVWRKSLHDEFGYFDESYKSSADYEFWLRIAQKYEFIHLKELVGVYWWDNNSVSRNGNIPIIETREIKKKYNRIYLIGESDKLLPIESIVSWEIIRGTKTINSVQHKLKINCPECSNKFVFDSVQEFKKTPGVSDVYCPKCKQTFTFSEDLFAEYLKSKYDGLESAEVTNENNKLKVAYFLKDAHVISGGAKVALKHISWLMRLGVEVIVYSFETEPKWIDFKINFKQLKSFDELDDKEFNKIIVFSIFEVPGIIQKVHPSRVFLFCQGFEGYHYGKYLEDVRSSKFIIDEMHHLPIGIINVSPHLTNLFDNRYAKTSYYIPNGIDHNTFKPRVKFKSRDESIVFIGSPFHFLKGFPFLVNTLKAIQKSSHKIEDLKLKIVMGFNPADKIGMARSLEKEAGIKVEIMSNLSSSEVSTLLQNSSILICSSIYEGFSLPILEAMASGTPVITTRNMGAEGFCIDEKNSFIVNYGDIEKLGGRILEIMRDMTACNPMVSEGIKTSYKFSERNTLNALKDVFESILGTSFEKSNIDNLLETVCEPDELSYEEVKDILIPSEKNNKNEVTDLVSIIIPTFNKSEYVVEAVKSIEANTKSDYEIIVVDDGSTENLIEPFKNNYKVTVIRNEENSGFPKSVNRGLQAASGKYILLVNNDTVCTKNSIDRMIELANSDEKIGLVGVISNDASGPQWDNEAKYSTINQMHAYANKLRLKNKGKHYVFPRIAFLFTLIKKEVIDKIGGLDERFSPGYYEDDDFCLRAQLGGFKGIIAPDVFIHHHGSVSFSLLGEEKRQKLSDINRQKFKDKWGGTTEEVWLKGVDINIRAIKYSINKDDFSKHFERALQHVEDNEIELADIEIEKAISNYSKSSKVEYAEIEFSDVLNLAGKIAFFKQDYEKAKMYYEEELKAEPESSTACQGLGEVFYTLEMMEEAKTMFEWAMKNNLQNAEALSRLTKVNLELGLPENDNSLLDFDPREIIANAENLIEQEKYDEAEALLLELLDKEPNYIDALNDLSVIYILQNDFENALKLINQVITADSANEIAKGNFDYINQRLEDNI